MGMLDYIIFDGKEWQTKSLENNFETYTITKEGELLNEKKEKIDFHGIIYFYRVDNNNFIKYKAKFTDGKLMSVENVSNT